MHVAKWTSGKKEQITANEAPLDENDLTSKTLESEP